VVAVTSDTLTRTMTTAAVLLVAAIAAVISYIHIAHLAVTHGQDHIAAVLLPLSIDGLVAAMSGYMFRCARRSVPIPWLARFMLALAVAATLAANVLYGIHWGVTGALISGWPAVAFVGCVEVSVLMVRKTRPAVAIERTAGALVPDLPAGPAGDSPAGPAPHPLTARVAGPGPAEPVEVPAVSPGPATMTVKQPKTLTVAQQAKRAGVSERTMYRRLAKGDMVTANGNGRH
jgi:Protein of unknown function (DUF2637)